MDNLISRQAAIDIVEFECGEWIGLARTIVKAIKQLPPAQPDAPDTNVGDMILRQDAINACIKVRELHAYDEIEEIKHLPSAQPARKTGKWIDGKRMKLDGTFYWFRQCDQCGYERNDCDPEKDSNFCPDCGADMRGEQHEIN